MTESNVMTVTRMFGIYFFAWFGMMVLAIANGAIREFMYRPYVGELAAHQISTIILLVLYTLYLAILMSRWPVNAASQAWIIGGMWLLLTLLFEFGFGHFVTGSSWDKLLHDYNLLAGRVWVFVPVWIFTGPYFLFLLLRSKQ
jgi:hypothetical protein